MTDSCWHCGRPLGKNPVISEWNAGRKVAIARDENRLWAICRKCGEWNLSPLDERQTASAIETLQRRTVFAPSTEGSDIALAETDGLTVVRVGSASGLDYACWRYRKRLSLRHYGFIASSALLGVVSAQLDAWPLYFAFLGGIVVFNIARNHRSILNLPPGAPPVRISDSQTAAIDAEPDGWALRLKVSGGEVTLRGRLALDTLRACMPHINAMGATRKQMRSALDFITALGGPDQVIPHIVQQMRTAEPGERFVLGLPTHVRLALEMALNESHERAAVSGELAHMPLAAARAREIAEISDDL